MGMERSDSRMDGRPGVVRSRMRLNYSPFVLAQIAFVSKSLAAMLLADRVAFPCRL